MHRSGAERAGCELRRGAVPGGRAELRNGQGELSMGHSFVACCLDVRTLNFLPETWLGWGEGAPFSEGNPLFEGKPKG